MLIEAVSEEARHWPFPTAQIALHLGAFALLHMFLQFTALYLSNKSHETTKRSSGKARKKHTLCLGTLESSRASGQSTSTSRAGSISAIMCSRMRFRAVDSFVSGVRQLGH